MKKSGEVMVFCNPASEVSRFDIGMSFMAEKPILLINRAEVQPTPEKSFNNVLLAPDEI